MNDKSTISLLRSRHIMYNPVVPNDRRSRHIIVKDKDDPVSIIGASLQDHIIVVHWADGFNRFEVKQVLSEWWPAALRIQYD